MDISEANNEYLASHENEKTEKHLSVASPPDRRDASTPVSQFDHGDDDEEYHEYPSRFALACLIIGVCITVFLISLDRTIITTAIPSITRDFQSFDDVGWYGSAYLVTTSAFQPLYGRVYSSFNIKWSYLASMVIFEIGSLLCGIAPSSAIFIAGRAISGVGSAGLLTGSFVVVSHAVPLERRPLYTACIGLLFGVGAVVGPLLGGVFTDDVSWRWCFYLNLPPGALTFGSMIFFFSPIGNPAARRSFRTRVFELDLIGNIIILGAAVMLFLALQFTEMGYAWTDPEIIGMLAGSGATFIIWFFWLHYRGDNALVPLRIVRQRTVACSCLIAFFVYGSLLMHSYYLPQWFQAIKGDSAITSGIHMIPYMVANSVFSLIGGIFVSKTGYFTPPAILGLALAVVGCGFISTLGVHTPASHWIGYQIIVSAGFGLAIQQGFTAVQTVLPIEEIAIGTAAVVACQSFGGSVFVSVGNTILNSQLDSIRMSGVNIQQILDDGPSLIRDDVPHAQLPAFLELYNHALSRVFLAAIPLSGIAFLLSLGLEWKSVKKVQARRELDEEEVTDDAVARRMRGKGGVLDLDDSDGSMAYHNDDTPTTNPSYAANHGSELGRSQTWRTGKVGLSSADETSIEERDGFYDLGYKERSSHASVMSHHQLFSGHHDEEGLWGGSARSSAQTIGGRDDRRKHRDSESIGNDSGFDFGLSP